ncbi:MAG: hypothetical protein K9G67_14930 [Bacteroidales bacterium]|nr:hypothetical protein [Bacteroidales bacterium]MCF8343514.1 hypothetical protein [Bacteroidales bacterium]MCF8352171.1 hypothetical protein [Bacteroidales bacterium]MCF8377647.1 hypothetical protein [Bacteroidales bacterium]
MTTIKIRKNETINKTEFDSFKELYLFLKDKFSPVEINLVNDEDVPYGIKTSIEKIEKEGDIDIIDFKG